MIAAHDAQRQIPDDGARLTVGAGKRLANTLQFGDQLAGALTRVNIELHVAKAIPPCCALAAQRLQPFHAPFIAGASGFDPFAYPDFFLCPEFIEAAIFKRFGGQLIGLLQLVRRPIAGIAA